MFICNRYPFLDILIRHQIISSFNSNYYFLYRFQYKLSSNMQRCPYIHEMKERLLGEQIPMEPLPKKIPDPPPFMMDPIQQPQHHQPVATVVKVITFILIKFLFILLIRFNFEFLFSVKC